MQCNCSMGLFADICRAWLTVDSDLFVWNYETNDDLASWDGPSSAILRLGLARPQQGVFLPHVQRLLVVATIVDVSLLAVSFSRANEPIATDLRHSEMHLLPEPLFRISFDGVVVTDIACTNRGRIFLAARDGCLYELEYQDKGWFRRHCKKINHSKGILSYLVPTFVSLTFGTVEPLAQLVVDETRHRLFTRSEKGSIQVFDLGSDGLSTSLISHVSPSSCLHSAQSLCSTVDPCLLGPTVHISPVLSTDSHSIALRALTASGVRLYFSCSQPFIGECRLGDEGDQSRPLLQENARPMCLRLVHVRLPPGFAAGSTVARPTNVHLASATADIFAFVACSGEDNDTMWALTNANFPFRTDLMETLTQLPIRGRTWAIAETGQEFGVETYETAVCRQSPSIVLPVRPPLVVFEYVEKPTQMAVLSAQGITVLERKRPTDLFRTVLIEWGADSRQIHDWLDLYGPLQTCAMCISVMSNGSRLAEQAVRVLFLHGGDPQLVFSPLAGHGPQTDWPFSPSDRSIADWTVNMKSPLRASTPQQSPCRPRVQFGSPRLSCSPMDSFSEGLSSPLHKHDINPPSTVKIKHSHRHDSLYLHFSRIVGPLWNMRMCIVVRDDIVNLCHCAKLPTFVQLDSAFLADELQWLTNQLTCFRDILDAQSLIPAPQTYSNKSNGISRHDRRTTVEVADTAHTRVQLNKKHHANATNFERQSLLHLYELVVRSAEVLSLWRILTDHQLYAIVQQLPSDIRNTLTDLLFCQLVVVGKNLCSDLITCLIRHYLGDRATTNQISEQLRTVCPGIYTSDDATTAKATELVQQATSMEDGRAKRQLLDEAVSLFKSVVMQLHLPTICLQLQNSHAFDKVVELASHAAEKTDPQNLALATYKNPELLTDGDSLPSKAANARSQCYSCIMDALDRLNTGATLSDLRLTEQMAQVHSELMINSLLSNDDQLAHVALFDWMLKRTMNERLLKSNSVHLEQFLQFRVEQTGELRYLDLLWKLYEKQGRYQKAAMLLYRLAERHDSNTDLQQRLAYLSQAVLSTQSAPDVNGELLQELRDKLEVGRLQQQTRQALRCSDLSGAREAASKLTNQLIDLTTLYSQFAVVFDMAEIQLAILHSAGHFDKELIQALWTNIVEKQTTSSDSIELRSRRLSSKLVQLGRLYSNSPRYLPTEYLCRLLQRKAFECNFPTSWLPSAITPLGVSPGALIDALLLQYHSADPVWRQKPAQLYLMNTVLHICEQFAQNGRVNAAERRSLSTKYLDAIASFLVELQMPSSTGEFHTLKRRFQAIQAVIERY